MSYNSKKFIIFDRQSYVSIISAFSLVLFTQSTAQAQTNVAESLVPVVSLILEDEEQVGDNQIPISDCADDEELAEIDQLLANNISDPRIVGAVQIFNQSDVDALAGVIIATATFAFESTDGADLDLSPLSSLVEVRGGNINMRANTLTSYTGFDCLKAISGNLIIENNANLEVFNTFPLLETVGSNIQIGNNGNLTNFPEFPSLVSASFIQIIGNSSITEIVGFPLLSDTGFFQIDQNQSVQTISGLNSLISLSEGIGLFQVNPSSAIECDGQEGTLLCP